ncbi:MAG: VWA domain-containing protein [Sandaracinaceae bacterium]|nr:VWA domain-containing protein [Sandaracinaceae bacterium]
MGCADYVARIVMRYTDVKTLLLILSFGVVAACAAGNGRPRVRGDAGLADASTVDAALAVDATNAVDAGASIDGFVACETTSHDARAATRPADIIWVVDNSASMRDEESYVQTNINRFSSVIAASGTDHHVVMISDTARIVVPPPLGGSDSFLAIDQSVNSHDALELIISTYPSWQHFLRPGAIKHFVVVSDDESHMTSAQFRVALAALTSPGFADGFVFHAIVAETLGFSLPPGPCFDKAENIGEQYIDLQVSSDGIFSSLCQTNWTPVFDALAEAVLVSASLPCAFEIPAPPTGQVFVADQVNLAYTPAGSTASFIPQVANAASCTPSGGWYYDDVLAPSRIITCPSTCDSLTSDGAGNVAVAFGCATILF